MDQLQPAIERAVRVHLPGRTVQAVRQRDEWVRRIAEVTLDGARSCP